MARLFATSDYYRIADPSLNTVTAYTLAAWIYWDGFQNGNILCGTDGSGPLLTWSHAMRITASNKLENYTYDGSPRTLSSTTSVPTNTYIHVAVTAENGQPMKVYFNGTLEATGGFSLGTLYTGLDRWQLGNVSQGVNAWSGRQAEVAMWRSVLSGTDIANLANGSQSPLSLATAPRWYLPLCGTGTEVDASANALTVTVSGTPSGDTHPAGIANGCGFATGGTGACRLVGSQRIKTHLVGGVLA